MRVLLTGLVEKLFAKRSHSGGWCAAKPDSGGSRRASRKAGQGTCAVLLLALVVSVPLVIRGAQDAADPQAGPKPQSTSLNGSGNVFLTANLYGSGGIGTVFVAVADFNGDGKLDYVTANNGNNTTTVGIALGNGDGTFKTPSTIAVPCGAVWVATGDFNGDGKTDLAVASVDCGPGTNGVSIFLGNGDGTFTPKGTLTSPLSNPFSIAVGDFNGDGKMDLAVVDRGASTDSVFFYLGNGDGTFQAPTAVSLGGLAASNQIVAADFNKDGHLDVAVSQINGSNVIVILGVGNGTFQAPRAIALPAQGWGLAVGDINGDGVPDLVATSPSIGGVSVFLGKGDGNFTPVNNPATGTLPTATAAVPGGGCTDITVGDFNKDGKLDIAAGLAGVNSAAIVAVLLGNGDGTLQPERLWSVADTPQSLAVGDFNGDGNLDWIASTGQINSANQGSVTLGLGRGDGTFLASESYVAGQNPAWAAVADFNKDGKLDVVATNSGSGNSSILLGNGDGTFQPATNVSVPGTTPGFVVTGDFNGDGNPDFITFNSPGGFAAPCLGTNLSCMTVFLGKGDGTFQAGTVASTGATNIYSVQTGDFNGDGKLDLALLSSQNQGNTLGISILLGNGDGTFQAPKFTPAAGTRATWMSVGDLNKDGKLDLVVVEYSNNQLQIFMGNGDGTFKAPTTLATGRLPGFSVLGDFNGDGNLDIFVGNQQDVNAEVFLGVGDGTFLSPSIVSVQPTNSPPSIEVVGDFNLDGHLDVLLGHNDERGTGLSLLLGNGDGTFQTVQNYLVSGFSGVTAVGDFNGDGAPDALLVDSGEEFISILLNQTPPPIAVSPLSLSFGNQLVGTTSSALMVKVSNNGGTATTVGVSMSGDYAQTNTCPVSPATLAPTANCNISVTFKPTATGLRTGSVTVTSTLPGSPQMVALTGTGVAPVVTLGGNSISFSNQIVGTSSSVQMVSLSNTGSATLMVSSIAITGTNSGDFSQTNTCGASVAIGANCSISVTFKPTTTGMRAASVTITDDASGSPQSVSLTGTGVAPVVSFGGTSILTFNAQPVGTTSAAQSVTLANTGNAALAITSIAITGANSGDFSEANTCPANPATLAAGANCSVSVTFKPTATGTRNASLAVTNDAAGSPQSVSLTGTGTATAPTVSLSPTSLSFGNQRVGTGSAAQAVTLTNNGNAALSITSIAITGTNSGDFSQTNTCGASVAAGANCSISVTFKPTATGARVASVTITDNAAGSPQSVSLTGTGTAPTVMLSSTTLNFSGQLVTTSSAAQSVTLTNSGTATLNISSIAVGGANAGDFSQTNTCGATIAAAANCSISVTFKPTATGNRVASVAITDDAAGSPQAVTLAGIGTDYSIDAAPGGSASATAKAGSPATYNLQVTPISGFNGTVALSCTGAPSEANCSLSPNSGTPSGAAVPFTATVSTTAPSMIPWTVPPRTPPQNLVRLGAPLILLLLLLVLHVCFGKMAPRKFGLVYATVLFAVVALASCLSGCGGGGGGGIHNPGTPPGTYTLTITGTSGNVSHTQRLTLTVN